MNPLSRGYGRYDKPYKATYERKKQNYVHSFKRTDPISLIYERPSKPIKLR